MLAPDDRPHKDVAQGMISSVLKRFYMRFAMHFTLAAGFMLIGSVLLAVLRAAR